MGEGPGEFKWAHILLPLPGDSVAIFDADLLRVSILDADLETARTVRIPAGFRTAVVADWPVVIANGVARTAGDFGHPYHVLSLGQDVGSIEVSFGGDGEPATPRSRSTLTHFLARGDHGSLWTVPRKEYSVRKWAFSGAPLARLDRKPAWFPGESRFGPGGPNLEPPPNTNGLMADSLGRIWTFVNVPREEEAWRATWAHVPPDYSGPLDQRDAPEPEELWSTIVEVMEPGSGRVFARGEMDDVVLAVLADRTLAVYRENEEGIPYIAVLEIFLDADGPAT
ncbi:MAG: hypothetical protein PVJ04_16680 [Gemmatimonadota bacterium]